MESLSLFNLSRTLEQFPDGLFTTTELVKLFPKVSLNTLYARLKRLKNHGAILELKHGQYLLSSKNPSDFTIANFLYAPSYVSLESALSMKSIITGFPHQITSVTTKKTRTFTLDNKEFAFHHLPTRWFFGFEKINRELIADKEKALLDFLYFCFKGLRQADKNELDLSEVNRKKIQEYLKIINNARFTKFVKKIIC